MNKLSDEEFLNNSKKILSDLETIRLDKLKVYNFRKKLCAIAALILTPITGFIDYWLLFLRPSGDNDIAGITVLLAAALYAWASEPKRQYSKSYKMEILPLIAKLIGNLSYEINGKIKTAKMHPSKILPKHHKYISEDYFYGEYKDVDLEFSEIHLKVRRRSNKRTRYVTVFKGLAVLLKIKNKKFFGHTIIDKNGNPISEWFKEKSTGLERAEMVDPEFEDIFDVYTNDQVESRYLIDPLMIENLNALYKEYNGKKMSAAFYDDKMLILISSKHNHFEPNNIHTPATQSSSVISMKNEVKKVLSIIDKLSLYDPSQIKEITENA